MGRGPEDTDGWQLQNFGIRLDEWISQESPDADLRYLVTEWVLTRFDTPYQGMRRESGFENLWWGAVPGSRRGGRIVVCSYFIEEQTRTVRCNSIATLSLPL